MAKKLSLDDVTEERIIDLLRANGLPAAKEAVKELTASLEADCVALRAELGAKEAKISQMETLLLGAVKKLCNELGIYLDQSADKTKKGRKPRGTVTAVVWEKVLEVLKGAKGEGLTKAAIAEALKTDPANVTPTLDGAIENKLVKKEGKSRATTYKLAK